MGDDEGTPSVPDLAVFAEQIVKTNAQIASSLLTTSHQNAANLLVLALLVRELGRAGVIDTKDMGREAVMRAEVVGAPVATAVRSIFGGEMPRLPEITPQSGFTVIRGGRSEP